MALVSNKFLAALSVKLGLHKHIRFSSPAIEAQNREYAQEVEEAERESNGARDYWTTTKNPPKVPFPPLLHPRPTLEIIELIEFFTTVPLGRRGILPRRHLRRLGIRLLGNRTVLRQPYPLVLRRPIHLRHFCQPPPCSKPSLFRPSSPCHPLLSPLTPPNQLTSNPPTDPPHPPPNPLPRLLLLPPHVLPRPQRHGRHNQPPDRSRHRARPRHR